MWSGAGHGCHRRRPGRLSGPALVPPGLLRLSFLFFSSHLLSGRARIAERVAPRSWRRRTDWLHHRPSMRRRHCRHRPHCSGPISLRPGCRFPFSILWAESRHIDNVAMFANTAIALRLSLPPVKLHCSMLAEDAIKAAVSDYKQKQAKANNKRTVDITATPAAAATVQAAA